jgi:hypothetical protein
MGASPVKKETQLENILGKVFDPVRVSSILRHFVDCEQNYQEGEWEVCLTKAGKFIEAIVKVLWIYCGKLLPPQREFKASQYAQKITNEDKTFLPYDEIRLQIPRGCIFIYDITSNRGARHDPEEVNPNEMDATLAMTVCSWILAELVRFSAKGKLSPEQAKSLVDSITRRRYPTFEEIDGRIYVHHSKYQNPLECAILILYKLGSRRIDRVTLFDLLKRHGFERQGFRWDKLVPYIDENKDGKVLLRATGRQEAEEILNRRRL